MKKLLLVILICIGFGYSNAQTATNFTCNDCSGVSHDLFTELDAGKVIVLDWVMPCGACAGPSSTAYNVVNGYQASHPGRVFLYMVDDYANTVCATLNGWANSVSVPQNAHSLRFSNASINMQDYGSTGMPKIVVVGGTNHTVFYNANNTVNSTALTNAIDAALSATGLTEQNTLITGFNLFPNPSDKSAEIKLTLSKPADVKIELFNLQGKRMQDIHSGTLMAGENKIAVPVSKISAGMYLVKVNAEGNTKYLNLVVSH